MEGKPPRNRPGGTGIPAGILGFLIFFLLTTLVGALAKGSLAPDPPSQPIAFNHRRHVEDLGLECSSCHPFYERETFSGLPNAATCAECHLEPLGESPEEERLLRLLEAGSPLEWNPLFRQPPHVFYSHRNHVAVAKIECQECHGVFAGTEVPPDRVKRLRMEDCLHCHEGAGASRECTACHR